MVTASRQHLYLTMMPFPPLQAAKRTAAPAGTFRAGPRAAGAPPTGGPHFPPTPHRRPVRRSLAAPGREPAPARRQPPCSPFPAEAPQAEPRPTAQNPQPCSGDSPRRPPGALSAPAALTSARPPTSGRQARSRAPSPSPGGLGGKLR